MGKTNKEWHRQNRMPSKATEAQRIAWHVVHAENCACRPMPERIAAAIRKAAIGKKTEQQQ